jgi:hypothetical protein
MQKQNCSTAHFESHFDFAFFVERQEGQAREAPQRPVKLPVLTLANRFYRGSRIVEASRVRRMT